MDFKDFNKCIDLMITIHNNCRTAYSLGIDMIEHNEKFDSVLDILWDEILTPEGNEWLSWYLYEKDGISGKPRKDLTAFDGKKEICKNLKDLHTYLEKNLYFNINKKKNKDND
jgi:hypothetical protein